MVIMSFPQKRESSKAYKKQIFICLFIKYALLYNVTQLCCMAQKKHTMSFLRGLISPLSFCDLFGVVAWLVLCHSCESRNPKNINTAIFKIKSWGHLAL